MTTDTLKAMLAIMQISQQRSLRFTTKLQRIIEHVTACLDSERGSIMILRGRQTLEVVASTIPALLGVKQPLTGDTPSTWVFKNKRILYVGPSVESIFFQTKSGTYKREAFLVAPIFKKNRVLGVLSITEKKGSDAFDQDERELLLATAGQVIYTLEAERLNAAMKKNRLVIARKNQALKKLERIRTELFNMLIHDLKGPLSEIVAHLDILSYTVSGEDLEYVQAARNGCDTLFRMVTDLLDITRLEEGALSLVPEKIVVRGLLHEAMLGLSGMAQTHGVAFHEVVPDNAQAVVLIGDRGLLMRVLQNLLINAIQHSSSGAPVEAGVELVGNDVRLYVQDQGPGIAPELHDAVFQKFFQITKQRDGRRYSTGLGLTFCKLAVDAHRGTIHVVSDGVKGSRFIITLPLPSPPRGHTVRHTSA